jgi:ABC-type nitrate/sulfonate/bicarbonate transport system permease component
MTNRQSALRTAARSIISVLAVFVIWGVIVHIFSVEEFVVPTPTQSIKAVIDNWSDIWPLALETLWETVVGFVAGAIIGFVLAVAISQSSLIRNLLYPSLVAGQAVPIIAVAAPLVIILGFGLLSKVAIVAWIVFFPVTVSVVDGLASVDSDLLNLAKVMGGSPARVFFRIKLPATITPMFSGLKIGATYAVAGAVIGELVASQGESLAGYQRAANGFLNTALVYGVTLVMTAIGISWFLLVVLVERLTTPWRHRSTARSRGLVRTGNTSAQNRIERTLGHIESGGTQ